MSLTNGSTTSTHVKEVFSRTRLHHQRPDTAWQQFSAEYAVPCWTHNLNTEKPAAPSIAEATRGHHACVRAVFGGLKLADPGITTEPRGLTAAQSRPSNLFATAAVPGRSAALDVCVASPIAAAAQGDAAQAAFDRKLPNYRQEPCRLEHCITQQMSHLAAEANICRRNRFNTVGNLRKRAAMTRAVLQLKQNGFSAV